MGYHGNFYALSILQCFSPRFNPSNNHISIEWNSSWLLKLTGIPWGPSVDKSYYIFRAELKTKYLLCWTNILCNSFASFKNLTSFLQLLFFSKNSKVIQSTCPHNMSGTFFCIKIHALCLPKIDHFVKAILIFCCKKENKLNLFVLQLWKLS